MSSAALAECVAAGKLGGCLWLYSNYHCNIACGYCLTESSPRSERRLLGPERMEALTREAAELGFASVGVAGGEPFLLPELPELLGRLTQILPTVVLTNGTLFTERLLARLKPLAERPLSLQVSLDSADPAVNDRNREPGNFETVVGAIRRLRAIGLRVRLATTGGEEEPEAKAALCALHRELGIAEEDHILRPVIRRGRAYQQGMGVAVDTDNLPPELTITADGAFWSPFAPTLCEGRLDTDLLLSRVTTPLSKPAEIMVDLVAGRPPGSDATLEIR